MQTSDRLLLLFVVGIVVVAATALFVAVRRPGSIYRDGTEPADVVHNYLTAVSDGEYPQALAHLSPTLTARPQTPEDFRSQIHDASWLFPIGDDQNVGFTVLSTELVGDLAFVDVRLSRFSGGGLFDSSRYTIEFEMKLARDGAGWTIVGGEHFFLDCWQAERCPQ